MNLLLGANGSGKSNVLETIRLIRSLVCDGDTSVALFPVNSLCRWETRKIQTFEIDLGGRMGSFTYKLEIEQDSEHGGCCVKSERLSLRPVSDLCLRMPANGQFYQKWRGPESLARRVTVPALALFTTTSTCLANSRDSWHWYGRSISIRTRWPPRAKAESVCPNEDMSNFAAWYRHLVLDQPTRVFELTEVLKNEVLDGFRSLRLKAVGEKSRALWAEFGVQDKRKATGKGHGISF